MSDEVRNSWNLLQHDVHLRRPTVLASIVALLASSELATS